MNPKQFDYSPGDQDIFDLYQPVLNNIMPSYQTVLYPLGWKHSDDPHPTPAEHLTYLDAVLPGWVTKAETRVKMHEQSINLNKDPRKSGMTKVTRL
jgi:DNA-binding GntR family transcriptional regulator